MIIIYKKLHPQDSTWDEMGDGIGYNMARPEGREQIQPHKYTEPSQDNFSGVITDFFGFDPTHTTTSLIPEYSECEPVLRTPSPEPEIQADDDDQQYGRGHRQHKSQDRLSHTGPRPRVRRPRRRGW